MDAYVLASPFYAFGQSDLFARLIVLGLMAASVLAWSIILDKWLYLKRARQQSEALLEFFAGHRAPEQFFPKLHQLAGPLHTVATAALVGLAELLDLPSDTVMAELRTKRFARQLSAPDCERLRVAVTRAVDDEIIKMEERLGLLSSIVAASPFLGLLGTVWGVMMAFCGMAIQGKADINVLAPGVSGALLTTVVGLVVAIPALIGYNVLAHHTKLLSVKLDNFAAELSGSIGAHCMKSDDTR